MEDDRLLSLAAELGYRLMVSGAEIYRTEDSVRRLMVAYGRHSGEVFAIPNCITVSLTGETGEEPRTRIRRIPAHDTSIELLERYNALCRELCAETPGYDEAMARLRAVEKNYAPYSLNMKLVGYFAGCAFFTLFFQGSALDALFGGLCGVVLGLLLLALARLNTNNVFKTIAAAAASSMLALVCGRIFPVHSDLIIVGVFMPLVPGITFTTALRDILAGDMVSGIAKAAEGILVAISIAVGTGMALAAARLLWGG